MIDRCQTAYNKFYAKCEDKDGLPVPVKQGSLILNVAASVNDHAANETARVKFISKIRDRIASQLGEDNKNPLVSFYCNTHKAMLLAKALREADHQFMSTVCPDRDEGEFRTSNLLDSFEIQISKMFGHHIESYAFGHGVDKFPAWMMSTHGDRWRGFKRLVGNRAQIFLENSVAMYYMAEYYLEYCDYVLRKAKMGNALHQRLDAKLRSSEMRAGLMNEMRARTRARTQRRSHTRILIHSLSHTGLRARAIAFIQIQQPLRVASKSNKFGGGKRPSQAHMLPVWQKLFEVAERMENDPEFLLDSDYFIFDDVSTDISRSCSHYRTTKSNSPMVEKLFFRSDETHDLTITILKSYGSAIRTRLCASQGGAAEFLTGGKLHNATGAVADLMKLVAATSDPIESFFGIHDMVKTKLSKNTSFHVTSTLATWRHNHTTDFLKTLSKNQVVRLMRDAVKESKRLKRETDDRISESAADKLKHMQKQAKATREAEKKLIDDLLELREQTVFKTIDQYRAFADSVDDRDKEVVKEIQKQIRLLNKVSTLLLLHTYRVGLMCIHSSQSYNIRYMDTRENI